MFCIFLVPFVFGQVCVLVLACCYVWNILSLEDIEEKLKSYLTDLDVNYVIMLTHGKDIFILKPGRLATETSYKERIISYRVISF